jgi:hypothetical protein
MRKEERTVVKKVIDAFRNFANELRNHFASPVTTAVLDPLFSAELTEAKWLSSYVIYGEQSSLSAIILRYTYISYHVHIFSSCLVHLRDETVHFQHLLQQPACLL